jgi:hypothetical protein
MNTHGIQTDDDMRITHITERDFQLLRRHAWERASWRIELEWFETRVLWPAAIVLACAAVWELMRW